MSTRIMAIAIAAALAGALLAGLSRQAAAEDGEGESAPYVPKVLERSLSDRALEALREGKHTEAITLYQAWLKADPKDATSWYNLACLLALEKRTEEALAALETSIDAGFDDLVHARKDTDLVSLHGQARFTAALTRGEAAQAAKSLPGMQRHHLATETIGTYIVLLPQDYETSKKTYPVVVILHGSGSSEIGHARVAKGLGLDDVIYVAPRALHPHTGVFLGSRKAGWTAWPAERTDPGDGDVDPMRLYVDWIAKCIGDVAKRYRIDSKRVFAWGHSQGAGAANVLAALYPERIAGIFAYAGYYPEHITDEALAAMKKADLFIALCHGKQDPVVAPGPTREMGERLQKVGVRHEVHMIDAQHGITEDVQNLGRAWMKKHVHAPAAPPATPKTAPK